MSPMPHQLANLRPGTAFRVEIDCGCGLTASIVMKYAGGKRLSAGTVICAECSRVVANIQKI